jgi:hypothetical protein
MKWLPKENYGMNLRRIVLKLSGQGLKISLALACLIYWAIMILAPFSQ